MAKTRSRSAPKSRRRKRSRVAPPVDRCGAPPGLTPRDPTRGVVDAAIEPWQIVDAEPPRISTGAEPTAGRNSDAFPTADQLEAIETRIAAHLQRIRKAFRIAIDERIAVGKCLGEAKRICEHGRWLAFLKRFGLNDRTAQEWMRFAEHEALIKEKTHGRADLTVEAVRKMLPSSRKATGQGRKTGSANGSGPGCGGARDRTPDDGAGSTIGAGDRRDATTGASADAPQGSDANPATDGPDETVATDASEGPASESLCDGDCGDGGRPADATGKDARTGDETALGPETACRGDAARSKADDDGESVATTAGSPEETVHRHAASERCDAPATGNPKAPPDRGGDNARDGVGESAAATTGGPERAHAGSSSWAEELSLEDVPLRDQLADPTIFDALARLEHLARPHFAVLEKLLDDATIQWHLKNAEFRALSIAVLIHRLVSVPSCKSWILCWRCHGNGKAAGGNACMTCGARAAPSNSLKCPRPAAWHVRGRRFRRRLARAWAIAVSGLCQQGARHTIVLAALPRPDRPVRKDPVERSCRRRRSVMDRRVSTGALEANGASVNE